MFDVILNKPEIKLLKVNDKNISVVVIQIMPELILSKF